jgi:hypothetical protein
VHRKLSAGITVRWRTVRLAHAMFPWTWPQGYRVAPRADSAINVGLRLVGIHAPDGFDEFAAAGLSAHRCTSDWRSQ